MADGVEVFYHHHLRPVEGSNALGVVDTALALFAVTGVKPGAKYGVSTTPAEGLAAASTALRIRSAIELYPDTSLRAQDPPYTGQGHFWLSAKEGADVADVLAEICQIKDNLVASCTYQLRCRPEHEVVQSPPVQIEAPEPTLMIVLYGVKLCVTPDATPQSLREHYDATRRTIA